MRSLYFLLPQTHVLFFGPLECARHTFGSVFDDPRASILVIDDVQSSLGSTEDLVEQAVLELSAKDPTIRGFVLCSACQTAFLGIDIEALCWTLHQRTGLCFAHVEANRMAVGNIPGPQRKNVPGGDRFHIRKSLFKMLEQGVGKDGLVKTVPQHEASSGNAKRSDGGSGAEKRPSGILVLSNEVLADDNDLKAYLDLDGIEWVRSVADLPGFDEFLDSASSAVVIATTTAWREAGEYLANAFKLPFLYLPTSYDPEEIEAYYQQLDRLLAGHGCAAQWEELRSKRASRAHAAKTQLETLRGCDLGATLDLRGVSRPFSLLRFFASMGIGFDGVEVSRQRVVHVEDDDRDAFEWVCAEDQEFGQRLKGVKSSRRRGKGKALRTASANNTPPETVTLWGAKDAAASHEVTAAFPSNTMSAALKEASWWGYSSMFKLFDELMGGIGSSLKSAGCEEGGVES